MTKQGKMNSISTKNTKNRGRCLHLLMLEMMSVGSGLNH